MIGIKIYPSLVLGVIVFSLVPGDVFTRRHHPMIKQTASSISSGGSLSLNTTRLFGLYLKGNFTVLNSFRNKVMDRFVKAYTDTNCEIASNDSKCNNAEIVAHRQAVVARRQGYYVQQGVQHSRQKRFDTELSSSTALCGEPYNCFLPETDKRQIEQKCWLFDIFGGVSKSSLHKMSLAGSSPTWRDIAHYLQSFKDILIKSDNSTQHNKIYREIECELRAVKDTKSEAVVEVFNIHANLIKNLHEYLSKLRSSERKDGTKVDCFDALTNFLKQLNKLGEQVSHTRCEDVKMHTAMSRMMKKLEDPSNTVNQGYTAQNNDAYFCHHKILVAYTSFKQDRLLAMEELKKKFQVNPDKADGLIEEMTENVFEQLTKFLLKTMLMAGNKRYADKNKESDKVDKVYGELARKLKTTGISTFNSKGFWKTRIDRLQGQISKESARRMRF